MAGRIKGITVEIGGDTTGLDKALQSVGSLTPLHPPKAPQSLDLPIFFWSNLHFPIVVLRVL